MRVQDDFGGVARRLATLGLVLAVCAGASTRAHAQDESLVQAGDLIFGLSQSVGAESLELIRGPVSQEMGGLEGSFWLEPFLQSVEFDNLNGISHNPNGNLLGTTFGTSDDGGAIYSLATLGADIPAQLIGNTTGLGGDGIGLSRLGGISVSPDNSKIAVTGYDTGTIIVFDYVPGNGLAEGASLSGARESAANTFPADVRRNTHGTAWLDSNQVLLFGTDGKLQSINATTLETTLLADLAIGTEGASSFTDIEYNPTVSSYVYASNGVFADGATTNTLYVFDPSDNFALVKTADFSLSSQTFREIALGPDGSLFVNQFSGLVDFIPNVAEPANIADDSSVDWYFSAISPSFSGMDVAVGLPLELGGTPGDFNDDGLLDAADIDALSAQVLAGTNPAAYDLNADGLVNEVDREIWVEELKGTYFGDSNLDLEFSTSDLVTVFAAGQYEDGVAANSGWATGDWSGDLEFNSGDIVLAFQKGGFELGPRAAVASVPEPASVTLLCCGLLALLKRRRR